jgi:hypothetical protein
MNRISTKLLTLVGVAVACLAPLTAQSRTELADVPFPFTVGNRIMPAGKYTVNQINLSTPVFQITGSDRHSIMTQLGSLESGKLDRPSLTFVCRGGECVLAKVTPPNSDTAYALSEASILRSFHHKIGVSSMISVKLAPR